MTEVAADPDLGAAGPGQRDVVGRGPQDAHLTAHGRQSGPAQGGGDLLAEMGEGLLVHPAVGTHPHGGGGLTGTGVLGGHVLHSL
ncbi:hypothetical protein [Streptomyces sp. YIM B13518]|uniref:hypothetical protein n=1 Tax=Streptomyces sp. YIM B13518 TaxID=3366316 RepID=UPI0036C1BA7C